MTQSLLSFASQCNICNGEAVLLDADVELLALLLDVVHGQMRVREVGPISNARQVYSTKK